MFMKFDKGKSRIEMEGESETEGENPQQEQQGQLQQGTQSQSFSEILLHFPGQFRKHLSGLISCSHFDRLFFVLEW